VGGRGGEEGTRGERKLGCLGGKYTTFARGKREVSSEGGGGAGEGGTKETISKKE
jgi:hypothetical protein